MSDRNVASMVASDGEGGEGDDSCGGGDDGMGGVKSDGETTEWRRVS